MAGAINKKLSSKLEKSEGAQHAASNSGLNGSKKGVLVEESVRQKIRLRFVSKIQENTALASLNSAARLRHAHELEEACRSSSSSRSGPPSIPHESALNSEQLDSHALFITQPE